MRIDKGLVLQIEVAKQEVFFVMFQLVMLQEDTLSLDFIGQIADRFVVGDGFALDADQLWISIRMIITTPLLTQESDASQHLKSTFPHQPND